MTILFFRDIQESDASRVGGKGFSLGRMAAKGLPVHDGFVLTTDAYRNRSTDGLAEAYRKLGGGLVAVRSSATAEDAADTSFAGQQETFLGVEGEALIDAVERCWKSLHAERAVAYRARQGIDESQAAMAVVVQKLVPAEVAGVLFTRDPQDPDGSRMLAEASWGLGEAVVSGRVSPDRFQLNRDTGAVLDKQLGTKLVRIDAAGESPVPAELQGSFCMSDTALSQLAELGRAVEAFYGDARDVEWAYADGTFHLLQARPITVATAAEREAVRRETIAELRSKSEPGGTVWVKFNLSEVLPQPTPMTWSIVQRLLAADGGFGAMNRDLGASPDPTLGSQSAFDLVAGRPMMNLARLPRMQFANPPIEYPFAAYKADPRLAMNPRPNLNPLRGGALTGLLRLPATVWRLNRIMNATKRGAETFADRFRETATHFARTAREAQNRDWKLCDNAQLIRDIEEWRDRTLVDFARDSLKPTVFADYCWSALVEMLKPKLGPEKAEAAVRELTLGAKAADGEDYAAGIQAFASKQLSREEFLSAFGHRCTNEMELSQPRWSEDAAAVDRLLGSVSPIVHISEAAHAEVVKRVRAEARLGGPAYDRFVKLVGQLRTYVGLREAAKHTLLLGYAFIRRLLVELDRRCNLNGGIFFLTTEDFPALLAGTDLRAKIAAARKRRQAELALEVPPVLFSDDLDAIGRPLPLPAAGDMLTGVALSSGAAEGPALVLTEPTAVPPGEGYVLVCPSTDPAWVPLFLKAKALVMETGGVLSHGAIVAREFGLPAVAGLPGITTRVKTGQRLHVDGARGTVSLLEQASGDR
jgi:phosphohistidine swiveling domain-containing protein